MFNYAIRKKFTDINYILRFAVTNNFKAYINYSTSSVT